MLLALLLQVMVEKIDYIDGRSKQQTYRSAAGERNARSPIRTGVLARMTEHLTIFVFTFD